MKIPLSDRVGIQFEIRWVWNITTTRTFKKWCFEQEFGYQTTHKEKPCVRVRGFVQLLGFSIGVGIFYSPVAKWE